MRWLPRFVSWVGVFVSGTITITPSQAASVVYTIPMTLSADQISLTEVQYQPSPVFKDVWDSGMIPLSPNVLFAGDTLTLNFNFMQSLQATDLASNPDTMEMVFWAIGGSGTLAAPLTMPNQWEFLDPAGQLLSPTISGDGLLRPIPGQVQGLMNPIQAFRSLNLTDSSFTFDGLRLTMTIPNIASGWTPSFIRIEFASDDLQIIPIPEPVSGSLAGLVVATLGLVRWRRRREQAPRITRPSQMPPKHTMQRMGASRLAQLQFGRRWRLVPTVDGGR